jgi:RNA polymerase sigma-70 factor (ECF subfamily)
MKGDASCAAIRGSVLWGRTTVRDGGVGEMTRAHDAALADADFRRLLEPCRRKLYGYIVKSLGFSAEADDVYQETLLRAFQFSASFRRGEDFAAWIFGIAHNEIRRARRAARRTIAGVDLAEVPAPAPESDAELIREVYRFAERLKPRHKEVFFLFYDSGFKVAEIARVTGLREGNVKFILNRARRALRTILGETP